MGGANTASALTLTGTVSTLASTPFTPFSNVYGVTTDGTNLYVADTGNNMIRQIVISTGVLSTVAGSTTGGTANGTGVAASFFQPRGITTDGTNLYVVENAHTVRQIVIATGVVTTLAGSATSGSANGTGAAATFNSPYGITTDGTNLYVADTSNNMIRQIVISTGVVTTLAGSTISGSTNGTGVAASFNQSRGITSDGTNLYVADSNNSMVRKIVISTGVVTTVAGSTTSGNANGTGVAATFNFPSGITLDSTNLYVADSNNARIRKIVISTGVVTTLAGSTAGNTDGLGVSAQFSNPAGLTTDGTSVYVADYSNGRIRKVL